MSRSAAAARRMISESREPTCALVRLLPKEEYRVVAQLVRALAPDETTPLSGRPRVVASRRALRMTLR